MGGWKAWTEREDAYLREHFTKRGPSWEGWATLLPGRTMWSIAKRAKSLGIPGPRGGNRPRRGWDRPGPKARVAPRPAAVPRLEVALPAEAGEWDDDQLEWLHEAMGLLADTGHSLGECVAVIGAYVSEYRKEVAA